MTSLICSRLLVRRRSGSRWDRQRCVRNAYQAGDGAQMWLSASIVAVAVVGGLGAAKMLASIRVGLHCGTASPTQNKGGPPVLRSGCHGAISGNHKSGSKLATGETKPDTWYGARR